MAYVLDSFGQIMYEELGFDKKEFLTPDEMKTLLEKIIYSKNISDPEEWVDHIPKTEFYRDSNTIIKRFMNKPNGIKIVEFK